MSYAKRYALVGWFVSPWAISLRPDTEARSAIGVSNISFETAKSEILWVHVASFRKLARSSVHKVAEVKPKSVQQ